MFDVYDPLVPMPGDIRGSRLEALKGDRSGEHSIRINSRWRICFTWRDGN
jgi:plasmid maintenance system killer protein